MNPTSQSPRFSSGPNAIDEKTLRVTLVVSTALAFVFILILYVALSGRSPIPRVSYGILMSVLPAFGAYVVLRITNIFISRRGAVIVYVAFFVLALIVHALVWLIPVASYGS